MMTESTVGLAEIKEEILSFFDIHGYPPSFTTLCNKFHISTSTLWKKIRQLEKAGLMRHIMIVGRPVWWPTDRPTPTESWKFIKDMNNWKNWAPDPAGLDINVEDEEA